MHYVAVVELFLGEVFSVEDREQAVLQTRFAVARALRQTEGETTPEHSVFVLPVLTAAPSQFDLFFKIEITHTDDRERRIAQLGERIWFMLKGRIPPEAKHAILLRVGAVTRWADATT